MLAIFILIFIIVGIIISFIRRFTITYTLILINLTITFILLTLVIIDASLFTNTFINLAYILYDITIPSRIYTIFTSMFLQIDLMHLLGNMIILFFIGIPLEEEVGKYLFLAIYLTSGIIGALFYTILYLPLPIILIGASGAISGLLGAMLYMYPDKEIPMIIPLIVISYIAPRIKAWKAIIIFFAIETVMVLLKPNSGVAHEVHVVSLIYGLFLGIILTKLNIIQKKTTEKRLVETTIATLESLATTEELKEIITKIKSSEISEIRDAWLEKFFIKAKCPRCGGNFVYNGKRAISVCGYSVELLKTQIL